LSVSQALNNTGLYGNLQRPNVVPGVPPGHEGSTIDNLDTYLNPDAWTLAEPFTFGNAPRTDARIRSPFRQNWDVAFQKTEPVGPGSLTVRLEIINLFDHPDFRAPATRFGSRNFGQIQGVSGFPRLLQIMIRFNW
jgi:hypothetical protein